MGSARIDLGTTHGREIGLDRARRHSARDAQRRNPIACTLQGIAPIRKILCELLQHSQNSSLLG
jgi:hypothetical protein